jgi:hypothetical protein
VPGRGESFGEQPLVMPVRVRIAAVIIGMTVAPFLLQRSSPMSR